MVSPRNALRRLRRRIVERRGNAILEFAFIFPVLLTLFGGTADFGLFIWTRSRLVDAVSYGGQYAVLIGTGAGANTNITSAVTNVIGAAFTGTTVAVIGPACYCLTGNNPPTIAPAASCGTKCASNNTLPGTYVNIQTSYTYTPLFSIFSNYLSTTMYEGVTMRVQ